jgi:hypothetical protein
MATFLLAICKQAAPEWKIFRAVTPKVHAAKK